jgi:hypothetical protein
LGIASRSDASNLPKIWGQSVQRFRRSIDWKLELFLWSSRPCFWVRGGRSASSWRTVRVLGCSSRVHRVLHKFIVRSIGFRFPFCTWFEDGSRETLGQSARRFFVRTVRGSITDSPIFQGAALLVRSAFSDSLRVVAGRSATPSQTVRQCHTDSLPRLLQFRVCASVLVCLLPLLVPRLLGGSFEVV